MSTIKVDTIQKNGGASEISIDKLGGVTAAGSILVVGEGGTNTINLQGGLTKAWADGTNSAGLDNSFNISSGTDNGTGDYTIAITNSMGNGNYSISTGLASYNGDADFRFPTFIKAAGTDDWSTMATGSYRLQTNQVNNGASAVDPSLVNKSINGDLA